MQARLSRIAMRRDQRSILLAVLLTNFLGALVIFFYFAYIDLETYLSNKAFWRGSEADWITFTLVMALASVIIILVSNQRARSLLSWGKRLQTGLSLNRIPTEIRRRAATYPLFIAGVTLAIWIIVGLFFAQGGLSLATTDAKIFWRTFLGIAVVGGLLNATLVFLISDNVWRRHLHVFLLQGHIKRLNVPRLSVSQRLIAIVVLAGLVPLIILGIAAYNGVLSALVASVDPFEILNRLQITILFIVGIGVISNVLISAFTARSLLYPLNTLNGAMEQVAQGDMCMRLPVYSNDEMGDLAENFNHMLKELEQGQRMRDLFGRYVSREVAEQALNEGADLGGDTMSISALFANIRDFTGLTERLPPQRIVDMLNRYYVRMVECIVKEGGMVNKFGGDSLLAVFGAPIRQSDHALRAVRAAWRMNRALAEFNVEQLAQGLPTLTIGIGISSGDAIAGNVGGSARLEYTVIGDPVNVAARLQGLTKELNQPILLSEATRAFLERQQSYVKLQPCDCITVRGRQKPTWVYALPQLAAQQHN